MTKSHVVGWTSDSPTPAQLKELFTQIQKGKITKKRMQFFLRGEGVNWLERVLNTQRRFHQNFFGQEFDLTSFESTFQRYGEGRIRDWQKLG